MTDLLTARVALELVSHEALVLEWYKDSEGIGTWGIGVTDASGHDVDRYKDKPQTVEHVLAIYVWLLRSRYMPAVLSAFVGYPLTEAQFAAALSFHYNTGEIGSTSWVTLVKTGEMRAARTFLETHYLNDGTLALRRRQEAALFFEGRWSQAPTAVVYPVLKPSYQPDFRHPQHVVITAAMATALAA